MELKIVKAAKIPSDTALVVLGKENTKWTSYGLSDTEAKYIQSEFKNNKKFLAINQYTRWVFVIGPEKKPTPQKSAESLRRLGHKVTEFLNKVRSSSATLVDTGGLNKELMQLAEGMALSNYQFMKYRNASEKAVHSLKTIQIYSSAVNARQLEVFNITIESVFKARDLVNEPVVHLTSVQLSKEFEKMGKEAGFKVEVFHKAKIQALKMGGILAVNAGSIDPPTFTIMEYKPARAKNKKPYILVGKGVVFDTGGLSLKPTGNSMDYMKSDMAGSAAVSCTLYAIAKAKLPIHVIAIVPSTDNRPGGNAITPGDIITMYSGKTVEILNTDAEGRLILGDALSYAKKYNPELVIDLATLTGAASAAVGQYGIVCMGTASEAVKNKLKQSGLNVHERLAEFPFWDEYDELIRSDIADIKNIGGPYGGAITAGKFLQHFVDYPWMHFDIAGLAFLHKDDSYRSKGGTGVGIRLLFDFFQQLSSK